MVKEFDRKIILEDGQEYYGYGFGAHNEKVCEIVFNTSMVGYHWPFSPLPAYHLSQDSSASSSSS